MLIKSVSIIRFLYAYVKEGGEGKERRENAAALPQTPLREMISQEPSAWMRFAYPEDTKNKQYPAQIGAGYCLFSSCGALRCIQSVDRVSALSEAEKACKARKRSLQIHERT